MKIMFDGEQGLSWLQRDFGVFMVNLFDIRMALTVVNKQETTFADVFHQFVTNDTIDMRYKRADWRYSIRNDSYSVENVPLPMI